MIQCSTFTYVDSKSGEIERVRALTSKVAVDILVDVPNQISLLPGTAVILLFFFRSRKGDNSF